MKESDQQCADTVSSPLNQGISLDLSELEPIHINKSALERRISTLAGRRSVKKEAQIAWLIKAVSCIDLTSLQGDDTEERIKRLCRKAVSPVDPALLSFYGCNTLALTTGAVCVYHQMVPAAVSALAASHVPVAAVSTGFPAGLSPLATRLEEIRQSVAAGAREIDIVISRRYVLKGEWSALYDEIRAAREACGNTRMKTILATGEHATLSQVAIASQIAMQAGSDFIKTSTGMEAVNATLPVSLVMMRQIRDFYDRTGIKVGFKPAGGIKTAKDALNYLILVKEELGRSWLEPEWFRFGASSLLGDIERQLDFHAAGGYSVSYRHDMS